MGARPLGLLPRVWPEGGQGQGLWDLSPLGRTAVVFLAPALVTLVKREGKQSSPCLWGFL